MVETSRGQEEAILREEGAGGWGMILEEEDMIPRTDID
jgi:hypothetical protein